MTTNMNRVDRICGITRNVSLLSLTLFWSLLAQFGLFRNSVGFACAVGVFLIFLIPFVIHQRKEKLQEEAELDEHEKEYENYINEGIQNGSITIEDLNRMSEENEAKIKKNERQIRFNNIMIAITSVIAVITTIYADISGIMNLQEMVCVVILVLPSYQISKGLKMFMKKLLTGRGYCNEKC